MITIMILSQHKYSEEAGLETINIKLKSTKSNKKILPKVLWTFVKERNKKGKGMETVYEKKQKTSRNLLIIPK